MHTAICLSVYPMLSAQERCTLSYGYYRIPIGSPMVEVKSACQRRRTAIGSGRNGHEAVAGDASEAFTRWLMCIPSICRRRTATGGGISFAVRSLFHIILYINTRNISDSLQITRTARLDHSLLGQGVEKSLRTGLYLECSVRGCNGRSGDLGDGISPAGSRGRAALGVWGLLKYSAMVSVHHLFVFYC